jgi:hypothetical protein
MMMHNGASLWLVVASLWLVVASLWLVVASLWLVVASLWLHCGWLWLHCGLVLSLGPSCNRSYNLTTRRLLSNSSFYNAVPGLEANAPTDIVAALKLT